jgi:hypothetical protein
MKIITLISLLILIASCKTEVTRFEEPKNLIPRDSMVLIMEELTVLESHITSKYPLLHVNEKVMRKSGDAILKKYNINFKRFDESISYYGSRQDEMQSIYTEVQDSLNWKLNHMQ